MRFDNIDFIYGTFHFMLPIDSLTGHILLTFRPLVEGWKEAATEFRLLCLLHLRSFQVILISNFTLISLQILGLWMVIVVSKKKYREKDTMRTSKTRRAPEEVSRLAFVYPRKLNQTYFLPIREW